MFTYLNMFICHYLTNPIIPEETKMEKESDKKKKTDLSRIPTPLGVAERIIRTAKGLHKICKGSWFNNT